MLCGCSRADSRYAKTKRKVWALQQEYAGGGRAGMRKVLIIEDNEINREILQEVLENEFEVLMAENGQVGLDILKAYYQEISAILLDIMMPVMDGFTFLAKVKEDPVLRAVPVVVMTAANEQKQEERCLKLGTVEFLTKPYNPMIVLGRIRNMIRMREASAMLTAIEFDEKTGLYTRQAFHHYASSMLREHPEGAYDVFMTDVENFKLINGIYGETSGDQVLKYIADTLKITFPNGLAGSYGSDRMVVMVKEEGKSCREQLEEMIPKLIAGAPVSNMTLKVGLYENVDRSLDVSRICDRTISAVKIIKHNFEKNISVYDEKLNSLLEREHKMERDFGDALENGEFKAWYQPKFDILTEKITSAEALVRWVREDGTMIPPGEFIPLFERDGLIARLDEKMFHTVCMFQKRRQEAGLPLVPISINMSRTTLHREGSVARYVEMVKEAGIPVKMVPIELTESAAFLSIQIKELTKGLTEAGFSLDLDDFGSGYSSMMSLSTLPFDVVKIDKSLIDLIGDKQGNVVLEAVIHLAKKLGKKVVAEGVEDKYQLEALRKLGCDLIQGHYFSKPVKEAEFVEMLKTRC